MSTTNSAVPECVFAAVFITIHSILDKFDGLVNGLTLGLPAEIAARRKQYEYYRDKLLTFTPKI